MKKLPSAILLASSVLIASNAWAGPYVPAQWIAFVKVDGQSEPIPAQWLDTDEARVAHGLNLQLELGRVPPVWWFG